MRQYLGAAARAPVAVRLADAPGADRLSRDQMVKQVRSRRRGKGRGGSFLPPPGRPLHTLHPSHTLCTLKPLKRKVTRPAASSRSRVRAMSARV